jgi:hypothetical protein
MLHQTWDLDQAHQPSCTVPCHAMQRLTLLGLHLLAAPGSMLRECLLDEVLQAPAHTCTDETSSTRGTAGSDDVHAYNESTSHCVRPGRWARPGSLTWEREWSVEDAGAAQGAVHVTPAAQSQSLQARLAEVVPTVYCGKRPGRVSCSIVCGSCQTHTTWHTVSM